jgi:hypothetical protein
MVSWSDVGHRLNELMVSLSVFMPSEKMELVGGGVLDREVGTYRRENLPDSFPLTCPPDDRVSCDHRSNRTIT